MGGAMQETTILQDVAAPGKQAVRDLTVTEARDLLDWLEANHFNEPEVALEESGMFSVTWNYPAADAPRLARFR
jgi:hypothetical protein